MRHSNKAILLILLTLQISSLFSQNKDFFSDSIRAQELNKIANDIGRMGLHTQALDSFFVSLEVRKKIYGNDHYKLGPVFSGIGIQYWALGQNDLAYKNFKLAEKNYLLRDDYRRDPRIRLYINIGNLFKSKLDYKQALDYFSQSLALSLNNPNTPQEEIAFTNFGIADLYYAMNDFEKALQIIQNNIDNAYAEDQILYYELLAYINQIQGKQREAKKYYSTIIKLTSEIYADNPLNIALRYLNYAQFLITTNDYNEVLIALSKAFKIIEKIQPNIGFERSIFYKLKGELARNISIKTNNLSSFSDSKKKKLLEAIQWYNKSLKALNFPVPYNSMEQLKESASWLSYTESVLLLKEIADTYKEIANIGTSNKRLESLAKAIEHYQLASTIIQQARRELSSDESKIQLTELEHSTFQKLIQTAYDAYRISNNTKYINLAFQSAERVKSSSVFDQLSNQSAQENSLIPDSLLLLEKRINNTISIYSEKLYEENGYNKPDSALINKYNTNIFEAKRKREELNRFLETEYSDYYDLKYSVSMMSLADVQENLRESEVIIEYVLNETDTISELFTFVISKTEVDFNKTVLGKKFVASIESMFSFMSNPEYMQTKNSESLNYCQNAFYLFNTLLKPFYNKIQNKQLIIIPDGKLSYIPFDALLEELPDTSKTVRFDQLQYVIKSFSINYSNSTNLLFKLNSPNKKIKNKVIAFAPEYYSDSIEIGNKYYSLSPLPGVQKEVDIISKTVKTKLFKGADASEINFRKEIEKYDILHLAMHAFINDSIPSFSKMVFSQNNSDDLLSDGSINTADIYNLDLNAQLAVLSACNTGRGKLRKGEGIMSLARGFFYAGCPSIIMSLWEVEDQSGTEIMGSFYKNLKKGKSKNEALRQAKLEYLNNSNSRRAHPHYWLSYISLGNSDPLYKSYDFYFFIILIVILAAIVTDQVYKMKKTRKKRVL